MGQQMNNHFKIHLNHDNLISEKETETETFFFLQTTLPNDAFYSFQINFLKYTNIKCLKRDTFLQIIMRLKTGSVRYCS